VAKPVGALFAAEVPTEIRRPNVLPDDGVPNRLPGLPRPEKRGLSLVGETNGREISRPRINPSERLSNHEVDVPADFVGVVFDPPRLWVDLCVLSLRHRRDLAAMIHQSTS
jgi:hypothetical protein